MERVHYRFRFEVRRDVRRDTRRVWPTTPAAPYTGATTTGAGATTTVVGALLVVCSLTVTDPSAFVVVVVVVVVCAWPALPATTSNAPTTAIGPSERNREWDERNATPIRPAYVVGFWFI